MSRIYILEDDPNRMKKFNRECIGHSLTHDDTAEGFIEKLEAEQEFIDVVFLDHDLGGEHYVSSDEKKHGHGSCSMALAKQKEYWYNRGTHPESTSG